MTQRTSPLEFLTVLSMARRQRIMIYDYDGSHSLHDHHYAVHLRKNVQ